MSCARKLHTRVNGEVFGDDGDEPTGHEIGTEATADNVVGSAAYTDIAGK